jgi:hypothetical protein
MISPKKNYVHSYELHGTQASAQKTSFSFITLFKTSDPPPRLTFDVLNLVILSLQAFSRRQPVFYDVKV